jgi:hypothetical protein
VIQKDIVELTMVLIVSDLLFVACVGLHVFITRRVIGCLLIKTKSIRGAFAH